MTIHHIYIFIFLIQRVQEPWCVALEAEFPRQHFPEELFARHAVVRWCSCQSFLCCFPRVCTVSRLFLFALFFCLLRIFVFMSTGSPSLHLAICLYLNSWFSVLYSVAEVIMFIYKGIFLYA